MSHHSHLPPEIDEAIRSFIRRHKRALRWGLLAVPLLALLLIVVLAWGLLRGGARVKEWVTANAPAIRLPLEWEKPLGDAALAKLGSQFRLVSEPQLLGPLQRLAEPLLSSQTSSGDRFRVFVTDSKDVNALALPGGIIVFHRGLLERSRSAEEVQGVLAHEMAHVIKRHSVLQLAQNIGLGLLVQKIQGNENQIMDALVRDSSQLLGLKFSRDHERVADDLGWELLVQAQVNPEGMESFFTGLKASTDSGSFLMPFLSTHPAPQERLDRLRQKSSALGPREFRSFSEEFSALRAGLGLNSTRP